MSKSRRKQAKKKQSTPLIPPATLLRGRLEQLCATSDEQMSNPDAFSAALDNLVEGIKPPFFLQTMLKTYQAAPDSTQNFLDQVLPPWLCARTHLKSLEKLVLQYELDSTEEQIALTWLQAGGSDTEALAKAQQDNFFSAYIYSDDFGSQSVVNLFWYCDRPRRHVRGFNFLIDYNPPWSGAVKDIALYPARTPQDAIHEFVDFWSRRSGEPMIPLSAPEAKKKILSALRCNDNENIRLPQDLRACREEFVRYVLTLPDESDTPSLTISDFDALSSQGEAPEQIMSFEQNVGRRVRLESGQEVVILGAPSRSEDDW